MIWLPLAIILFALVSIGDGKITPSHWAFRCDLAVMATLDNGQVARVVPTSMNADGSMTVYILRDSECR